MQTSFSSLPRVQELPVTSQQRQQLVTMALWLTAGTPSAPTTHEQQLLEQYLVGTLSLEDLVQGSQQPIDAA